MSDLHPAHRPDHGRVGLSGPLGPAPLPVPRSPPNTKNLQHVPCKFFRQGTCSAGRNCVFSHNLDTLSDRSVCKYFAKGNCKFGARCALAHVMPNGRRVNRPPTGPVVNTPTAAGAGMGLLSPDLRGNDAPDGFGGIHHGLSRTLRPTSAEHPRDEYPRRGSVPSPNAGANDPAFSIPSFRSPVKQSESPGSGSFRTLGPLDSQIPSSFDSNDMSRFGRKGPIAASMPSMVNLDFSGLSISNPVSPSSSFQSSRNSRGFLSANPHERPRRNSSRPLFNNAPEPVSRRSSNGPLEVAPEPLSTSVPSRTTFEVAEDEDDADFDGEEFVPSSLQELLTPQERSRRHSRNGLESSPSSQGSRFGGYFEKYARENGDQARPSIYPTTASLARNMIHRSRTNLCMTSISSDLQPKANNFVPSRATTSRSSSEINTKSGEPGIDDEIQFRMDDEHVS